MALKGLTMPNRQWYPWTAEDLAAVRDLQPDVLLVLLYRPEIPASRQKQEQLFALVQDVPSIQEIAFRPYEPNIPEWVPEVWADYCRRRVEPYLPLAGRVRLSLIPDNERNLGVEHGHGDWERHRLWLRRFGATWRAVSDVPLHLGALSPGVPGWQEGLEVLAQDPEIHALYDVVDAHCYPGSLSAFEQVHTLFPNKVLDITEFNDVDPKPYMASLPGYVRSATWFILHGEKDQQRYWLMGSPHYQSFKEFRGSWSPIPEEEGETDVANYAFTLGFATFAQEHPDVGLPISDLMYDANGNALQYTENGRLESCKQANRVMFFRHAHAG